MALAAACLHLFAQSNWTGPSVQIHDSDLLPPAVLSSQVYLLIILSRVLIYQQCAHTDTLCAQLMHKNITIRSVKFINLYINIKMCINTWVCTESSGRSEKLQAEASQVSQHASYNLNIHIEGVLGFLNYETQFLKTCCLIGFKIYKRQEV